MNALQIGTTTTTTEKTCLSSNKNQIKFKKSQLPPEFDFNSYIVWNENIAYIIYTKVNNLSTEFIFINFTTDEENCIKDRRNAHRSYI